MHLILIFNFCGKQGSSPPLELQNFSRRQIKNLCGKKLKVFE